MNPGEVVVRVAGCALGIDPQAEIAGEVISAGDAAQEWIGRRVVVPRCLPCGDCDRCRRGHTANCLESWLRRGLAPEETVPARFLCSLEGLMPEGAELWQAAALADAAATPFAGLMRAGIAPSERVAVIGKGARAALAAAIVRAKGAQPVEIDVEAAPEETAVEVVLETTGSSAGRHRALAMLAPGATAVFLDGPVDAVPVPLPDWPRFVAGEGKLLGAQAAHPDLLPEVCALYARGELPIASLVTAIEPAQIDATLALRRAGKLTQLPIVRFH